MFEILEHLPYMNWFLSMVRCMWMKNIEDPDQLASSGFLMKPADLDLRFFLFEV